MGSDGSNDTHARHPAQSFTSGVFCPHCNPPGGPFHLRCTRALQQVALRSLRTAVPRAWPRGCEPQQSDPRGQAIPSALRKGEQTGKTWATTMHAVNPGTTGKETKGGAERDRGEGDRGQELPPPATDCWLRRLEPALFGCLNVCIFYSLVAHPTRSIHRNRVHNWEWMK